MTPATALRAQTASPLAPPRRGRPPAPSRPRRISGPVRPARPAPVPAPDTRRQRDGGLALGALALIGRLDGLASHPLLDRVIRGRVWIGLVAFALIGIVTLQLGLLKLNSGIGRSLEREAALQRENAALSVENSELAAGSRVESQAERLGMRLASVSGLKFLGSHARVDVPKAAAALRAAPAREPAPAAEGTGPGEATSSSAAEGSGEASPGGEASEASSAGGSEAAGAGESASSAEPAPAEHPAASSGGGEAPASAESAAPPASTGEGGGAAAPGG